MKGLHAYHLLNSGGFKAASCKVAGHLQLIGTNGTGKTTNLRIVSYFYNPSSDRKDHAIEKTKSSFNNFHFKGEYSYVIFEVCRGFDGDGNPDLYHVAVSKLSARIAFLFVDAPYAPELYLSDKRQICNRREVEANLMRRGINCESVRSYDEYKDIIYGTTRLPKYQPFVFANPRANSNQSIRTIPEILSAIFRAETMKTGSLKQALVASLGVEEKDRSINLEMISRDLKKFHCVRSDIRRFQEHIPNSEIAYGLYQESQRFSIGSAELAYQIQKALPLALQAAELLNSNIKTAGRQIASVNQTAEGQIKTLEDDDRLQHKTIGAVQDKLKEIEQLEREYPEEEMRVAGGKVDAIPELELSETSFNQQLSLIIRQFDNITERYASLRERETNTAASKTRLIETEWIKESSSINQQIQQVRDNAQSSLSNLDEDREESLVDLTAEVLKLSQELIRLEAAGDAIRREDFQKEVVSALQKKIQENTDDLARQKSIVQLVPEQIKSLEQSLNLFLNSSSTKLEGAINPLTIKKGKDSALLESAQRIVRQYSGSLLEFVDQTSGLDRAPFVSAIREDVLFAPSEEMVTGNSPELQSLFGVKVDLDSLPDPKPLDYESSVEDVEILSAKLAAIDKEIETLQRQSEKEDEAQQRSVSDKRTELESERNQAQVRMENCANDLETLGRRLDEAREMQDKEFSTAKEDSIRSIVHARETLNVKNEALSRFKRETTTAKDKIKADRDRDVTTLKDSLSVKTKQKDGEINVILKASTEAVAGIDKREVEELDGNTDNSQERIRITVELKSVETRLKEARTLLKSVTIYRDSVIPKIQGKSQLIKQEAGIQATINEIAKQIASIRTEAQQQVNSLNGDIEKYKARLRVVQADIGGASELDFTGIVPDGEGRIEVVYKAGEILIKGKLFTENRKQIERCWNGSPEASHADVKAKGIKTLVNQLLSTFSEGNHYDFPRILPETREDYGSQLKRIHEIISSGMHEKDKESVLNSYKGTMEQLRTGYEQMENLRGRLQSTVKGIEAIIAKDNFVSAVQSIEFQIAFAKNGSSDIRSKVEECCSSLDGLNLSSDQEDLFAKRPKSSVVSRLMNITEDLCDRIEDKKLRRISLEDLYELEIRVDENGHKSDWKAQVDGIGSNGTDKLVKIMIYIAILSHFRSKAFKNAEEIHLHSLMDENGAIHSEHVSQLLQFCSARGVYVGTAAPETHRRPTDFELAYEMCRSNGGKTATIRPILTHHNIISDEVPEPAVS